MFKSRDDSLISNSSFVQNKVGNLLNIRRRTESLETGLDNLSQLLHKSAQDVEQSSSRASEDGEAGYLPSPILHRGLIYYNLALMDSRMECGDFLLGLFIR